MARVIQSPGVEINEIDLSTRTTFPAGTNILIQGFSQNGPTDEVLTVTTFQEYETIYGAPTNAAERYFYHTVKSVFNSPANILVARLPYGEKRGNTFSDELYSALLFPVSGDGDQIGEEPGVPDSELGPDFDTNPAGHKTTLGLSACDNIQFGSPVRVDLLPEEYFALSNGEVTFKNLALETLDANGFASGVSDNSMELGADDLPIYWDGDAGIKDLYEVTVTGEPEEGVSKRLLSEFKSRVAGAGMVLVNKAQTTVNNYFEGYYIGFGDNEQFAVSDGTTPSANIYNSIEGLKTFGSAGTYLDVPEDRLNFATTADVVTGKDGSISEVFENIPSWDIAVDEFRDTIGMAVFKVRKSIYAVDTTMLDFGLDEAMVGSMDAYRTQANISGGKPKSFYLEPAGENSTLLSIYINKNISENRGTFLGDADNPMVPEVTVSFHPQSQKYAWGIGTYQEEVPSSSKKCIGSIPAKVERYFEKLQNLDEWEIDVTLDAGLSTIHVQQSYEKVHNKVSSGEFCGAYDDEKSIDMSGMFASKMTNSTTGLDKDGGDLGSNWHGDEVVKAWKAVANSFVAFAQDRRRDHITVLDPLRHIFVSGKNGLTVRDKTKNWSQHIFYPLKHLLSTTNTNYACTYGNWFVQYDKVIDKNIWVPPSGVVGAAFANNDARYQPWFAPAGFTRGLLTNVLEAAIRPNQKQRDQFYKIGLNPIAFFPADGYVIFGQKTLQAKPSAFDRINVRRMFLWTEKAVRRTIKYYVFEPNTARTRSSIVAVLEPIFQRVKNTQGLYDFLLVCDDRNNPPVVIDGNELVVDIYIKPVRAAEFILVNFYATRTDQSFSELVG